MKVYFMSTYYSQWAHLNLVPRSQEQWDSFKFCRAVKKRMINGSLTVPLKAGPEVIRQDNVGRARELFGRFLRKKITELSLKNPIIVPIPSKDGLIGADNFRSLQMIKEALGENQNITVCPALRFTKELQPANAGGPRGRYILAPYLKVVGGVPDGDVLLVDDIVTTGGSLLACYDKIVEIGRRPVAALVCGLTVSDSLLSAFGYHEKDISIDTGVI